MNSPAPYDFNINLSKHNFDNAKNQLKAFSQKTDLKIDFPKVDTEGGFLNLGNHRVTGYELNKVTEAVQKYLTFLNSNDISIIKEFNNVYQTFEYLDQEYLSGIILGIKAAEKNAEEIKCTQNGLKKTVEEQKKIIAVLKKHKEKLENIVHLEDIDETWGKISGFGIKLTNIQEDILKLELNIKELVQDIEIINENIRLIDVEAKEHTVLVNSLVYDVKKNNESILKIFSFIDNLKKTDTFI
ncbi:hypothetical protein [Ruminococcus sp. HUN007]|uniref:hypothetical protein n=1 Tax=Ruminococcus sp. HUN007 TaxID=1514668 RepID=UPI000679C3A9|nr:hypothetical protein [Ruminococcus sp. HUN007]